MIIALPPRLRAGETTALPVSHYHLIPKSNRAPTGKIRHDHHFLGEPIIPCETNSPLPTDPCSHIYGLMKTTIELPDEIFRKAKVAAAEQHTTLKELITQALENHLGKPSPSEEKKRQTALKRLLKQMQATNTEPMRPLKREEIHDR